MEPSLRFPRDLLRFFYRVIFRPFTLGQILEHLDPPIFSAMSLFTRGWWTSPTRRPLTLLALFYIGLVPWLAAIGLGLMLASCGMPVNWLTLAFYMLVGIALSLTFSLSFCVAFLTPFSLAVTVFSSSGFTLIHALLFSFGLGLAYSLTSKPAKWGLTAGLVYGAVFALLDGPWLGLGMGASFLAGFFRLPFYLLEAPLTWWLALRTSKVDASRLWRFQPFLWDELIWFPLPGLDIHLQALFRQNPALASQALISVRDSFRQGWAVKSK